MNKFRKIILSILLLAVAGTCFAQDSNPPVEMATGLYQSGKIYVVVAVMGIIFIGIAAYLVILDRKISRLEKKN
ncbi:MAG: CcmD family protein [Bacteroidia bacterium]